MITVQFVYLTGLVRRIFSNARLTGSWNGWTDTPMTEIVADDGCPAFATTVAFDDALAGSEIRWGVRVDAARAANAWGIPTEVHDARSSARHRTMVLPPAGSHHTERYFFTSSRRLGAQKVHIGHEVWIRFAVWSPNARAVDVVFARRDHGYIADDGTGIDPSMPVVSLARGDDGVWESAPVADFDRFLGAPYMFRIVTAEGATVYRTDIHSRWQIGRGDRNPARVPWDGDPRTLDGSVSCSVVIDQDVVREEFEPTTVPPRVIADDVFWAREFTPGLPVPARVEDLVIYELHIGSLGFPDTAGGTFADALALLDQLVELGVSTVELLPLSEFSGVLSWGYGNTHHFAIESSAGGRDKYKHFVRECHRRGLAVIQDVVYNHFDQEAGRAEWAFDSSAPERNIYYWYEGRSSDHARPDGGYVNNGSSGYAPRYWEEQVRQLFTSSAAELIEEFHVDGLRVDLTQAIHRDNALNADGRGLAAANLFGQKLLREWSRTLRLIRPTVMLIAEDHSGWDAVTKSPRVGGLGFDATWFAEFYHHLIGDAHAAAGAARLLHEAGLGHDGPLALEMFADRLWRSAFDTVVYHESHDEAGNAAGSARTSTVAAGGAPLVGRTREVAEARCRVVCSLAILSAGTPMFFMGEEVVAQKIYRYDNVSSSKEDLRGERLGGGARMFRFYQDVIRLRRTNRAVSGRGLDVVHAHGPSRVLAFTRRDGHSDVLVIASLSNSAYTAGYVLDTDPRRLPDGWWRETFNSDAAIYGGANVGNYGAAIPASGGRIELVVPANGVLVLQRE